MVVLFIGFPNWLWIQLEQRMVVFQVLANQKMHHQQEWVYVIILLDTHSYIKSNCIVQMDCSMSQKRQKMHSWVDLLPPMPKFLCMKLNVAFQSLGMEGIPSGYVKIAIENGHRNSGFSHEKWWFSIVMLVYQRVIFRIVEGVQHHCRRAYPTRGSCVHYCPFLMPAL